MELIILPSVGGDKIEAHAKMRKPVQHTVDSCDYSFALFPPPKRDMIGTQPP